MNEPQLGVINILVIDNNSPFVLPLLRSFSGMKNIRLDVLLVGDHKKGRFIRSRYMGRLARISELNDDNVVEVVLSTAEAFGSNLLFFTREWIAALLFRHKEALEKHIRLHPLPGDSVLEITGNKWKLNHWLEQHSFPFARCCRVSDGWKGNYPVLLKPEKGIGGKGIQKLNGPQDLEKLNWKGRPSFDGFLLQEYIQGHDIDISCFCDRGEIIYHTIQKSLMPGKLVYSKGIEFTENEELLTLTGNIMRELNYTGIAHLDFRHEDTTGRYVLVDFNGRYWSSVQGSRAMGINFPYLVAQFAMTGKKADMAYRRSSYFFSTTAIRIILRNLFTARRIPVRLKDTQLYYIWNDPLPEFHYILSKLGGITGRKKNART